MKYRTNTGIIIETGFPVSSTGIVDSIRITNESLADLPFTLFTSIDYKTTSSIVGALFCSSMANITTGIMNPIEKGHPDVLPKRSERAEVTADMHIDILAYILEQNGFPAGQAELPPDMDPLVTIEMSLSK